MIKSLDIKNFRCIRDAQFSLAPLTVLIGPNDSGKTTIIDAIRTLDQLTKTQFDDVFSGDYSIENITWRRTKGEKVCLLIEGNVVEEGDFSWTFSFSSTPQIHEDLIMVGGRKLSERRSNNTTLSDTTISSGENQNIVSFYLARWNGNIPRYQTIRKSFESSGIYRLDPRQMRQRAVPNNAVLTSTGDNLASVLDGLLSGPDRDAVIGMEKALRDALPNLQGFATRPAQSGKQGEKSIEFVLSGTTKPATTIPCSLASDGAMLITAFLALAYSDTPEVLLIEEPENGLHPTRLKEVIDLLRKMTTGEVGNKPRQIILTTHSPLLLNYARPEEVRIVRRDPEQGTQVKAMSDVPGLDTLRQELGLGEIWYLLGEQAMFEAKEPS